MGVFYNCFLPGEHLPLTVKPCWEMNVFCCHSEVFHCFKMSNCNRGATVYFSTSLLIFFMWTVKYVLCSLMPEGKAHIGWNYHRNQRVWLWTANYCASVCVKESVSWVWWTSSVHQRETITVTYVRRNVPCSKMFQPHIVVPAVRAVQMFCGNTCKVA